MSGSCDNNLKKLFCLLPALKRPENNASSIMVQEVVVVIQIGNAGVYIEDGNRENGQGGGVMVRRYTRLKMNPIEKLSQTVYVAYSR
jgi:hypothetical protein